jgi:hypothetical protein
VARAHVLAWIIDSSCCLGMQVQCVKLATFHGIWFVFVLAGWVSSKICKRRKCGADGHVVSQVQDGHD